MSEDGIERAPPEIREQFKHEPVYCISCKMPVSVSIADDPQPFRWECSCAVSYPTEVLPEQWVVPDSEQKDGDSR